MAWQITTEPTDFALTVADARTHVDYEETDRDNYLRGVIRAAQKAVEAWEWRALTTQTLTIKLDAFPSGTDPIYVPRPPLQSVTHIKYVDTDGDEQTWSSDEYDVDTTSEPGRIKPAYSYTWPTPRPGIVNPIEIVAVAGYGDDADSVPDDTKQVLRFLVKHLWENPSAVTDVPVSVLPLGLDAFLRPCHDERVLEFC